MARSRLAIAVVSALCCTLITPWSGGRILFLGFSFDMVRYHPREALPKAKEAALKTLLLDNTLREAHTSFAMINLLVDWDW
jgi:hypothetical protein